MMEAVIALVSDGPTFVAFTTVAGVIVGSFLNRVISRLPSILNHEWREQAVDILSEWAHAKDSPAELRSLNDQLKALGEHARKAERYNLVVLSSSCPSCGHKPTVVENIPVLTWLWLSGRCAKCNARISVRYPVVEVLTGLLSGYAAWRFGLSVATLGAVVFVCAMITLAFIDLETTYLPDDVTQPLLWVGIILSLTGVFTSLNSSILGAIAGYLALWLVSKAWNVLRGVESMGQGDFKLLAAIGGWLGWQMLPLTIVISSLIGASVGLGLMIARRADLSTKIPFGPYLAIAGIIAMLHGAEINQYYLRLR